MTAAYQWRQLSARERSEVLIARKVAQRPWHSPPHWQNGNHARFHLTAACYAHVPIVGSGPARMDGFVEQLLKTLSDASCCAAGWCVLPNHYHLLIETLDLRTLTFCLGRLHGRSSRAWNVEENCPGRKVFHRTADRVIRSDAHSWATLNYIHYNPVRHGYVKRWTDWPWSSARDYLRSVGSEDAERIWKAYPLLDYGRGWDEPDA
jgi:putative transposase